MKLHTPTGEDIATKHCMHCPLSLTCLMGRPPGDAFYCKKCKGFSVPDIEMTVHCERFGRLYRTPTLLSMGTMYGMDARIFKGTVGECGACHGVGEHVRGVGP